MKKILTAFLLILGTISCKKELGPVIQKDISYQNDVRPILSEHGCEGCHNGKTYPSVARLDSFDFVKDAVLKDNFFPQLSPAGGNIYASMPPYNSQYVMLSDVEIEKIKEWIRQGFKK
jgi:hypothetical protein